MAKPKKKAKKAEAPKATGRPSLYSLELATRICKMVASGLALREVCKLDEMPSHETVYRWFALHQEFSDAYARAREERADLICDEVVTIADTEPDPNKARVRIDARKWWAAKVNPKKYGDRQQVDLNLRRDLTQMDDDELTVIASRGRTGTVAKANGSAKPH
jgi:hypothetical protein